MKILVIQQKMIGDVLTSSILFEALRHKYPEAQLHYLINEHTYPVVENNPFIDKIVFLTPEIEKHKFKFYRFLKSIKKERYDTVIDVYSKFSSNLISAFSRAKLKISQHKQYSSFIYTDTFHNKNTSNTNAGLAVENRLQLLEPISKELSKTIIKPKIYITPSEIEASKLHLINNDIHLEKPLFMISVLGSGVNKTYPMAQMARIIDAIVLKTKGQILFNYIPNQTEEAKAIYNFCEAETQKHIFFDVFGKSLREFLAITKHCTALIGNEGGAVNMAKALNIPTFTIFSPWIKKEAWSMFEDGNNNISIHLKDVKPELYTGTSIKNMKSEALALYEAFTPNFIIPKLNKFLEQF
ncbi:glycosyltransferase family 9 protein [Tamlana sp. 2_MG-2023]|uniref:glycosyltransferase family 9 protein n=1 Tax=unclassified Tamlana TaxID=2614803 RepID=UPI0026E2225C|nr:MULTISPECIES: glycosyltransferase family 9 protein [unclassified Tamlana]MDO6759072.1 glycosyltransferase family 9 protein [Tamlana sp. 2_MG-2023]MDO6789771.1 glycosyltransferase family 9 protein [Tamlana sp. 1_MG-2023]